MVELQGMNGLTMNQAKALLVAAVATLERMSYATDKDFASGSTSLTKKERVYCEQALAKLEQEIRFRT